MQSALSLISEPNNYVVNDNYNGYILITNVRLKLFIQLTQDLRIINIDQLLSKFNLKASDFGFSASTPVIYLKTLTNILKQTIPNTQMLKLFVDAVQFKLDTFRETIQNEVDDLTTLPDNAQPKPGTKTTNPTMPPNHLQQSVLDKQTDDDVYKFDAKNTEQKLFNSLIRSIKDAESFSKDDEGGLGVGNDEAEPEIIIKQPPPDKPEYQKQSPRRRPRIRKPFYEAFGNTFSKWCSVDWSFLYPIERNIKHTNLKYYTHNDKVRRRVYNDKKLDSTSYDEHLFGLYVGDDTTVDIQHASLLTREDIKEAQEVDKSKIISQDLNDIYDDIDIKTDTKPAARRSVFEFNTKKQRARKELRSYIIQDAEHALKGDENIRVEGYKPTTRMTIGTPIQNIDDIQIHEFEQPMTAEELEQYKNEQRKKLRAPAAEDDKSAVSEQKQAPRGPKQPIGKGPASNTTPVKSLPGRQPDQPTTKPQQGKRVVNQQGQQSGRQPGKTKGRQVRTPKRDPFVGGSNDMQSKDNANIVFSAPWLTYQLTANDLAQIDNFIVTIDNPETFFDTQRFIKHIFKNDYITKNPHTNHFHRYLIQYVNYILTDILEAHVEKTSNEQSNLRRRKDLKKYTDALRRYVLNQIFITQLVMIIIKLNNITLETSVYNAMYNMFVIMLDLKRYLSSMVNNINNNLRYPLDKYNHDNLDSYQATDLNHHVYVYNIQDFIDIYDLLNEDDKTRHKHIIIPTAIPLIPEDETNKYQLTEIKSPSPLQLFVSELLTRPIEVFGYKEPHYKALIVYEFRHLAHILQDEIPTTEHINREIERISLSINPPTIDATTLYAYIHDNANNTEHAEPLSTHDTDVDISALLMSTIFSRRQRYWFKDYTSADKKYHSTYDREKYGLFNGIFQLYNDITDNGYGASDVTLKLCRDLACTDEALELHADKCKSKLISLLLDDVSNPYPILHAIDLLPLNTTLELNIRKSKDVTEPKYITLFQLLNRFGSSSVTMYLNLLSDMKNSVFENHSLTYDIDQNNSLIYELIDSKCYVKTSSRTSFRTFVEGYAADNTDRRIKGEPHISFKTLCERHFRECDDIIGHEVWLYEQIIEKGEEVFNTATSHVDDLYTALRPVLRKKFEDSDIVREVLAMMNSSNDTTRELFGNYFNTMIESYLEQFKSDDGDYNITIEDVVRHRFGETIRSHRNIYSAYTPHNSYYMPRGYEKMSKEVLDKNIKEYHDKLNKIHMRNIEAYVDFRILQYKLVLFGTLIIEYFVNHMNADTFIQNILMSKITMTIQSLLKQIIESQSIIAYLENNLDHPSVKYNADKTIDYETTAKIISFRRTNLYTSQVSIDMLRDTFAYVSDMFTLFNNTLFTSYNAKVRIGWGMKFNPSPRERWAELYKMSYREKLNKLRPNEPHLKYNDINLSCLTYFLSTLDQNVSRLTQIEYYDNKYTLTFMPFSCLSHISESLQDLQLKQHVDFILCNEQTVESLKSSIPSLNNLFNVWLSDDNKSIFNEVVKQSEDMNTYMTKQISLLDEPFNLMLFSFILNKRVVAHIAKAVRYDDNMCNLFVQLVGLLHHRLSTGEHVEKLVIHNHDRFFNDLKTKVAEINIESISKNVLFKSAYTVEPIKRLIVNNFITKHQTYINNAIKTIINNFNIVIEQYIKTFDEKLSVVTDMINTLDASDIKTLRANECSAINDVLELIVCILYGSFHLNGLTSFVDDKIDSILNTATKDKKGSTSKTENDDNKYAAVVRELKHLQHVKTETLDKIRYNLMMLNVHKPTLMKLELHNIKDPLVIKYITYTFELAFDKKNKGYNFKNRFMEMVKPITTDTAGIADIDMPAFINHAECVTMKMLFKTSYGVNEKNLKKAIEIFARVYENKQYRYIEDIFVKPYEDLCKVLKSNKNHKQKKAIEFFKQFNEKCAYKFNSMRPYTRELRDTIRRITDDSASIERGIKTIIELINRYTDNGFKCEKFIKEDFVGLIAQMIGLVYSSNTNYDIIPYVHPINCLYTMLSDLEKPSNDEDGSPAEGSLLSIMCHNINDAYTNCFFYRLCHADAANTNKDAAENANDEEDEEESFGYYYEEEDENDTKNHTNLTLDLSYPWLSHHPGGTMAKTMSSDIIKSFDNIYQTKRITLSEYTTENDYHAFKDLSKYIDSKDIITWGLYDNITYHFNGAISDDEYKNENNNIMLSYFYTLIRYVQKDENDYVLIDYHEFNKLCVYYAHLMLFLYSYLDYTLYDIFLLTMRIKQSFYKSTHSSVLDLLELHASKEEITLSSPTGILKSVYITNNVLQGRFNVYTDVDSRIDIILNSPFNTVIDTKYKNLSNGYDEMYRHFVGHDMAKRINKNNVDLYVKTFMKDVIKYTFVTDLRLEVVIHLTPMSEYNDDTYHRIDIKACSSIMINEIRKLMNRIKTTYNIEISALEQYLKDKEWQQADRIIFYLNPFALA